MGVTAETLTLSNVEQCSVSILFFVQTQTQWHSQDIAYARAQHGHTTFVRTSAQSAEAFRGVWGHPPPKILQPSRSVLRSHRSENSHMRLVILWIYIAILRRSIS